MPPQWRWLPAWPRLGGPKILPMQMVRFLNYGTPPKRLICERAWRESWPALRIRAGKIRSLRKPPWAKIFLGAQAWLQCGQGNVFGHFEAQAPQPGGQICVNQAGFMTGVFEANKSLSENPSGKTPSMKPVWITHIWPPC